jgi:hypothetical protein
MSKSSVGRAAAVALITTALSGLMAETASAQAPTNPAILQAVQSLQSSVNALQSTINNVQTTVGGLGSLQSSINNIQTTVNNVQTALGNLSAPSQSNVRFTPPIFVDDNQGLLLGVLNVDSVPHKIKVELIDPFGNPDVFFSGDTPLDPGHATGGSKGLFRGFYYVRFTVLDGSRAHIRGTAQHLLGGGAIGPTVAAE